MFDDDEIENLADMIEDDDVRSIESKCALALRQLLAERKWQPISEAPQDGTPILAFCGHKYGTQQAVCWMENGAWTGGPHATPGFSGLAWKPLDQKGPTLGELGSEE